MALITRRIFVRGAATLAAALPMRKPWAAKPLPDLADALMPIEPRVAPPDMPFLDGEGKEHRLTEFRGHGMVVNLWATWCAPCVAELPSLAALSVALAPFDIAILPLSSDRGGAETVRGWFADHKITALPVLIDPKGALARAWHARGLPTTLVIDREGRECARLEGAADWSSQSAAPLIRRLVG